MKTLVCFFALVALSAHAETKLTYSGDAHVRGYFKNSTGNNGEKAFNQLFRFNVIAKPDDALSVKVGAILSSDTWEGDSHKTITAGGTAISGTNNDTTSNDNVTRLDHAVIEYNKNNWITSVGRHVVTTPGSFLTSDDRRDRIQVIKIRDNYDAIAFAYDKRAEGALTDAKDDLDMYSLNYYGAFSGYKYALQTGYWVSRKFNNATSGVNNINLDQIKQFSPQLEGKLAGIDFNLYYTVLWGGTVYYKDTSHAAALKFAHDFEIFKFEFQSMGTMDGGLIASGFDSLSSIVNSSPDSNQSSIKVKTIGFGLGSKKVDEQLHMLRFSKIFTPDFSATVGGGYGVFYAASKNQKNTIVDATARYSFSQYLSLNAAYGHFFGDFKDHAGSLTLKAVF